MAIDAKVKRSAVFLLCAAVLLAGAGIAATGGWAGRSAAPREAQNAARGRQAPTGRLSLPARHSAADQLITRWSAHVEQVYGTPPDAWARAMRPSLARLSEAELRTAGDMPTLELMLAATTRPSGSTSAPAVHRASKGSAQSPQLGYRNIAPCRLVDTRLVNARLSAGASLHLNSAGNSLQGQGGNPEGCGIPADAEAVVINVTAVDPAQAGYLTVFPYGEARPLASSLNYVSGGVAGNEIIAKQARAQPATLSVFSYAATDVVVDVVGYFAKPAARRLVCANQVAQFTLSPGFYTSYPVYCPDAFQDPNKSIGVGGSCTWQQDGVSDPSPGILSGALRSNGYTCAAENRTATDRVFVITAICCRSALADG